MLKNKIKFIIFFIISIIILILGLIRVFFATNQTEKIITKLIFNSNDVIYFGDSVLNADHENKTEPSSLVKIFKQASKKNTLEISGAAYTPFIYDKYFDVIKKYSKDTKLIIVPINLRAFSSAWYKVPEYQFEQECSYLGFISIKFNSNCIKEHIKNLLTSKNIKVKQESFLEEIITAKGFLNTTKRKFIENFKENCDVEIINNKKEFYCKSQDYFVQVMEYMQHGLTLRESIHAMRYNYHYAEYIEKNNISLLNIQSIIDKAKRLDFNILFYITPLNLDSIKKFSGQGLLNIVSQNLLLIKSNIKGKDIYFLNLINLLSKEYFEEECACEHVNEKGKKIIIDNIIKFIDAKIESK